jgi:hypothetical protein
MKSAELIRYRATTSSNKAVIAVAFYSTYGHIGALAEQVIQGVESTGAIVKPYVLWVIFPVNKGFRLISSQSGNPFRGDPLKDARWKLIAP